MHESWMCLFEWCLVFVQKPESRNSRGSIDREDSALQAPVSAFPEVPACFCFFPEGDLQCHSEDTICFSLPVRLTASNTDHTRPESSKQMKNSLKQQRTDLHLEAERRNHTGRVIKGASRGLSVADEARDGNPECHHHLWCVKSEKQAS